MSSGRQYLMMKSVWLLASDTWTGGRLRPRWPGFLSEDQWCQRVIFSPYRYNISLAQHLSLHGAKLISFTFWADIRHSVSGP